MADAAVNVRDGVGAGAASDVAGNGLGGIGMLIERFRDAPEVYVRHCHEGCAAYQDGRIKIGDRSVCVCMCVCLYVCEA
jgi:hypothetical protein